MVLAAGLGTRMRPLTLLRAKPALPVLNQPLIAWTLGQLARQGVREVVVNTHHLPRTVRAAADEAGGRLGLRVSFSHEPAILGTMGGPRKVRRFFGDEPFLLVNGDVLFDFDLGALVRRHRESGARATLALRDNPDPRLYSPVVTDDRLRVRALAGLPRRARGRTFMFTGVHVVDPRLLDRLPPGPSEAVRDLYAPLIAEGGHVQGLRVRGPWYDLGAPALYRDAQLALLRRPGVRPVAAGARVHPSARVRRSVVGRGAVVAAGARVERSILWDGVRVGEGAVVVDAVVASGTVAPWAEVREAVVMAGHEPVPAPRGR